MVIFANLKLRKIYKAPTFSDETVLPADVNKLKNQSRIRTHQF